MGFYFEVPLFLYVVLVLMRDVAILFNIICLRVAANGFYYNP